MVKSSPCIFVAMPTKLPLIYFGVCTWVSSIALLMSHYSPPFLGSSQPARSSRKSAWAIGVAVFLSFLISAVLATLCCTSFRPAQLNSYLQAISRRFAGRGRPRSNSHSSSEASGDFRYSSSEESEQYDGGINRISELPRLRQLIIGLCENEENVVCHNHFCNISNVSEALRDFLGQNPDLIVYVFLAEPANGSSPFRHKQLTPLAVTGDNCVSVPIFYNESKMGLELCVFASVVSNLRSKVEAEPLRTHRIRDYRIDSPMLHYREGLKMELIPGALNVSSFFVGHVPNSDVQEMSFCVCKHQPRRPTVPELSYSNQLRPLSSYTLVDLMVLFPETLSISRPTRFGVYYVQDGGHRVELFGIVEIKVPNDDQYTELLYGHRGDLYAIDAPPPDTECSICLTGFTSGVDIYQFHREYTGIGSGASRPDRHIFHLKCAEDSLKTKAACPLCRKDEV